MDTSLRKKFMSPFSVSRASSERSKHCPIASSPHERGQWSMPFLTPASASAAQLSKSESVTSSDRSQEKGLKSSDPTMENITERGLRQKVSRSLFSIKSTGCERKYDLEQHSYLKKQAYPEKEGQGHCSSTSDFLGTANRKMSISLTELSTPEILSETNLMNSAPDCIMQEELIGQFKTVEVQCPFDFCDLLKPEAVGKFRLAIIPTKAPLFPFTSLLDLSIDSVIDCVDSQDSCVQSPRQPKNKEKFIPMPLFGDPASSDGSITNEGMSGDPRGAAKDKRHSFHSGSLCESIFSGVSSGKRQMIRGFSIPRCGRLTNQSYQEQAKEFQEILSSKVRQIAEVADCLQHTELLYKILEI